MQDINEPPAQKLLELISSCWKTQAVYVAAELKIADRLTDGPQTSNELAKLTQTDPAALAQLLRALTTLEICVARADGTFELGALGKLLVSDSADSLRNWAIWWGSHLWPVWGRLLYSVQTGSSARELLLGTQGFGHLQQDEQTADRFHRAMAELSRLAADGICRAYDFSRYSTIVDIGGGNGELLARVLQATAARGILFDLPHAILAARQRLKDADLDARCDCVAGDFFQTIPAGGDLYLLKSIIHDWNDDSSRKILQNCRRAIGSGQLLLIEQMLPSRLTASAAHQAVACSDLNMLVALAARERTEDELRKLLQSAGLRVTRVLPAEGGFTLLEALADSGPSALPGGP